MLQEFKNFKPTFKKKEFGNQFLIETKQIFLEY